MALMKSDSYYEKVCTAGVVLRSTGKTSGQLHTYVKRKVVIPAVDQYTGFYLYSPEDIDKIKFAAYCQEELNFKIESLAYLMAFLKEVMPDYSWADMIDILDSTAKIVDSIQPVESNIKEIRKQHIGGFGRK